MRCSLFLGAIGAALIASATSFAAVPVSDGGSAIIRGGHAPTVKDRGVIVTSLDIGIVQHDLSASAKGYLDNPVGHRYFFRLSAAGKDLLPFDHSTARSTSPRSWAKSEDPGPMLKIQFDAYYDRLVGQQKIGYRPALVYPIAA